MPLAVGVVETMGFPAVLAAADAMVKAGRVTLVFFDKAESGRFYVAIRGNVSEVETALKVGVEAGETVYGGQVITHYIVPNPPENIESVLSLEFSEEVEEFRV